MGARGPRPKPVELARLHGDLKRGGASIDGVGDRHQLTPPTWFDAEHLAEWEHSLAVAPLNLITRSDRQLLIAWVTTCVAYNKVVQELMITGHSTKARRAVRAMISPASRQLPIITATLVKLADSLGYSPGARAGLSRRMLPETLPMSPDAPPQVSAGVLSQYLAKAPDSPDQAN